MAAPAKPSFVTELGTHLGDSAVVHRSSRAARDDDADMLDRAARRAGRRADMQRPPPAWFIGRATNRHTAYPNNLELALLKGPNFVGMFEPLQHHIHVLNHRPASVSVTDRATAAVRQALRHGATSRSRSSSTHKSCRPARRKQRN